jgi:hypothetical protein
MFESTIILETSELQTYHFCQSRDYGSVDEPIMTSLKHSHRVPPESMSTFSRRAMVIISGEVEKSVAPRGALARGIGVIGGESVRMRGSGVYARCCCCDFDTGIV